MKFNKDELLDLIELNPKRNIASSLYDADLFCKKITTSHYENFPVGSILIPKKLRPHFYSIYSFSRLADDIADEEYNLNKEEKIHLLKQFLSNLKLHLSGNSSNNPIFQALKNTIEQKNLPVELFERLISAFIADSDFKQPEKWQDLYDYCHNSANPIGELILRISDNYNEDNLFLSNSICTALQLANFWQDLSVDLEKGRIYLPKFLLDKYKIKKEYLLNKKINANFIKCLEEVYKLTDELFLKGENLHKLLNSKRLSKEIRMIWLGGKKILAKSQELGEYIIMQRPNLTKFDFIVLFFKSLF